MSCLVRVAKTKALISCAVTAQLICASVFAYAKCLFSHDASHLPEAAARIKPSESKLPNIFAFSFTKM